MKEETITKKFKLTINGTRVIDVVVEGDTDIVMAFVKEAFLSSMSSFYRGREALDKIIINGLEVSMATVFKDKKGRFIAKEKVFPKVKEVVS